MGTDLILLGSLGAVGPDAARLHAGTSSPPGKLRVIRRGVTFLSYGSWPSA